MSNKNSQANVNLFDKPGTIAYALKQNINEYQNINNLIALKAKLIEIVERRDINDVEAVKTFKEIMQTQKSKYILLETITTYMTGIKKIK